MIKKFFLTNFSRTEDVDGYLKHILRNRGMWTDQLQEADAVMYAFTWQRTFEFDENLWNLAEHSGKPLIVMDFHECDPVFEGGVLGAQWSDRLTEKYRRVHLKLKDRRPNVYFKRELPADAFNREFPFPIYPVDFMHEFEILDLDSEEKFHERPIDVCMVWGFSHVSRPELHGALMRHYRRFAWMPAVSMEDVKWRMANPDGHQTLAVLHIPHYRRIPIGDINWIQSLSKITISCYGAGVKCWRNSEACYDSIMAQQDPDVVQWAYPWHTGINCIRLPNKPNSLEMDVDAAVNHTLWHYLREDQGSLYPIYASGQQTAEMYHADCYFTEYLMPIIERHLHGT